MLIDGISNIKNKIVNNILSTINMFYNNKTSKIAFLLVLTLFLAEIFILNKHTTLVADDYAYSFIHGSDSRVDSLYDVFTSQYHHYFYWGGRSIVHALAQIFLMQDKIIFDIFNALAYIMLILVVYLHAVGSFICYPAIILFINCALINFTPAFGQDFLWVVGSCNYLWGSLISLAYLLPYRFQLSRQNCLIENKIFAILFGLIGIIASWTNENIGITVVVLTALFNYAFYLRYKTFHFWGICGFVGAIIGVALMIGAPGNYVRLAVITEYSYLKNFFVITRMFFSSNYLLYPIALVICFEVLRNKPIDKIILTIYTSGVLCVMYSMTFSPIFPDRAKLGGLLFAIIITSYYYLSLDLSKMQYRKIFGVLVCCLLLTNVRDFGDALKNIKKYEADNKERIEYVLREREKGNLNLFFPKIIPMSKFNALWGLEDLSKDENYWINDVFAKYYGLSSAKIK